MTEHDLVYLAAAKLLLIFSFVMLYVLGGRSNKWLRRYVGGIIFPCGVVLSSFVSHSFHWPILLAIPAYPIALCLGYGSKTTWAKILKRAIYGLALGGCALLVAWSTGNWVLGFSQVFLSVLASVIFGVMNPTKAVYEETIISLLSVCLVPFMV